MRRSIYSERVEFTSFSDQIESDLDELVRRLVGSQVGRVVRRSADLTFSVGAVGSQPRPLLAKFEFLNRLKPTSFWFH